MIEPSPIKLHVIAAKAGIQWRAVRADVGYGWIPGQARNDSCGTVYVQKI